MPSASDPIWQALQGSVARHHAAADYWPRLQPLLGRFGITRVGDITGLDRVGMPVVQVCRPRARSNAVTQGKGWTRTEAAIGAVLECIEMAVGEDLSHLPTCSAPQDPGPWPDLVPPGSDWPNSETVWVPGRDLATGGQVPVPVAVLDTDFALGGAAQEVPLLRASIGLGAGARLAEAAWQGLLEVIENDARLRASRKGPPPLQLAVAALASARARALLDRLAGLNLRVGAWDLTQRPGPITLSVRVVEDPARPGGLALPAEGFACRPTPQAAFEGALTEALQARLALISGAREDMNDALYAARPPAAVRALDWADLTAPGHPIPVQPAPAETQTVPDLARHLTDQGLGPILLVPLLQTPVLSIVRVVAPALINDPERLDWENRP